MTLRSSVHWFAVAFTQCVSFISAGIAGDVVGDTHILIDLGTLGGTEAHPAAINNGGTVVGWSFGPGDPRKQPFVWNTRDQMTLLFSDAGDATAADVNSQGWIVGKSDGGQPFLWKNGIKSNPSPPLTNAGATSLNDAGVVVGIYGTVPYHAFRWDGSSLTTLLEASNHTTAAFSINASGNIAGFSNPGPGNRRGVMWQNGGTTMVDLGYNLEAVSINDQNVIVGGNTGAWMWKTGSLTNLPSLGSGSGDYANAINNTGVIVGESRTSPQSALFACQWADANNDGTISAGEVLNLNNLLPANSGWVLNRATAINDYGVIVGEGTLAGKTRGFLLAKKATLSGTVVNNQLAGGTVRVVAATFASGAASASGSYQIKDLPKGIAYWVSAYLDINNNGIMEPWEPQGAYAGNPIVLTADTVGINITLIAPLDSDGDGMPDSWETVNGLINGINDAALDKDGDGVPNLAEYRAGSMANSTDTDGDGLSDFQEIMVYATNPALADTDGDGMPDGWEVANGLNPRAADANDDRDFDGLTNGQEFAAGLNPNLADSNNNGIGDYEELFGEAKAIYSYDANDRLTGVTYTNGLAIGYAYDGNSNLKRQVYLDRDGDNDGLPDLWEFQNGLSWASGTGANGFSGDADGDGWTNFQEWKAGTNPKDANSKPNPATTPVANLRQTAPLARVLPAPASGGGLASVAVKLWDAEGNAATPKLQYFDTVAAQWRDAQVTKLDGSSFAVPFGVTAEPGGSTHTLIWNTFTAFGATFTGDVLVRVRADDFSTTGAWSEPMNYHVDLNSDSDGDGLPDGWEMANTLDPLVADSAADIDGDGRSSFLEFALGSNPRIASPAGEPIATIEDGYLTLTVARNPAASALQFRVVVSGDLTTWFSDAAHVTILEDTPSLLKVRDNVPFGTEPKRFIRLEVTKP